MLYKKIKPYIFEMMYFITAEEYVKHMGEEGRSKEEGEKRETERSRDREMEEVLILPPDSEHPLGHNTAINFHVNIDPLNQEH